MRCKKILLMMLFLLPGYAHASTNLTVGYVPYTTGTNCGSSGNSSCSSNSNITNVGSNVGIGVASPIEPLDVNGEVLATQFNSPGTTVEISGTTGIEMDGSGNGWTFVDTAAGNVGIGTTLPVYKLDVPSGTARLDGLTINNNSAATGYVWTATDGSGDGAWESPSVSTFAAGGQYAVQYGNPAGTLAGTQAQFSFNGTNVGIGTFNATSLFEVAGSGILTVSNNVGIGTISPTGKLEIEGGNVGIGTTPASGSNAFSVFGGNVGIGTATSPKALYVVGAIQATTGFIAGANVGITTTCPQSSNWQITNGLVTACH